MNKFVAILCSERLILRGIEEADTDKIVKWRSLPSVYKYFKSPHVITEKEHLKWFRTNYQFDHNRFDWMCIEKTTNCEIGVFGIKKSLNLDSQIIVEVSYLLDAQAQHKGYAQEAIEVLAKYALEELGAQRMVAEIHRDNLSSLRLVKKMGFSLESETDNFLLFGMKL